MGHYLGLRHIWGDAGNPSLEVLTATQVSMTDLMTPQMLATTHRQQDAIRLKIPVAPETQMICRI